MKTYLVTGAAGFIGSNFIKYLLKKYKDDEIKIIILDALTYAGNLGTIKDDIDNKRCFFVKGNICDPVLTNKLFTENDIDYVINFAAESHVDRSIENPQLFLNVNILGCQNLMESARKAWVTGKDDKGYPTWKAGKTFPSGLH
jgi:dTDP-glucose 4,6-dehydratase